MNSHFYLFEDACDEVYNCISAFLEMITKVGLGKNNNTYERNLRFMY